MAPVSPADVSTNSAPSASPAVDDLQLAAGKRKVLFVDLDGTLLATDLFAESLVAVVRRDPRILASIPGWLARGRAVCKHALAERAVLDVRYLPFREDVLAFLQEKRAEDCKLVLATASDRILANAIAEQLGIFDDVIASDGQANMKGAAKLAAMQQYCRDHDLVDAGYVGDSRADLPIWQSSAQAYVVGSSRLVASVARIRRPMAVFPHGGSLLRPILRAMRPHQWIKNLLLFVPLVLAHDLADFGKMMAAVWACLAFVACSSSVYIFNDLSDLESDRRHPRKRSRPIAQGTLPIAVAIPLGFGLLAFGFSVAALALPLGFLAILALYWVTSGLYSFWLKRQVMLDVFVLAGLYTLRILAGGVATSVPVSEWLMAFSLFLFTSLAFAKRYAELSRLETEGADHAHGRGYRTGDLSLLETLGPTSGYLSVLVLALYIHGEHVKQLYSHPWGLWLICPLLLYWVSRVWLLARRGELYEDPVVFAITDRVSRVIAVLTLALVAFAAH
jgi:4-hydroxybenzoate polyprenyltransferase/phosphoserine phosphatase